MTAAELAVLVLFLCAVGDANATGAATTCATIRCNADIAFAAALVAGAGRGLRAEGVATADAFTARVGEAEAVGVGVVTVREPDCTVATTIGALILLGQGQSGDRASKRYTGDCAANAAKGCTTTDFLIGQGFGDIFEPVCHRHLLVDCVGGICAVLQLSVPRHAEPASSIQK